MKYTLIPATYGLLEQVIGYKLKTVMDKPLLLSDAEKRQIEQYVRNNIPQQIDNYQMIVVDNIICGCVLVTDFRNGKLIDEIYIEEDKRNKGIGSSILEDLLKQNSCPIYLWVYKHNEKAFSLYQRLGFTIIDSTETRYLMKAR